METITLYEQDLVNALCLLEAEKKQKDPSSFEVELMWDEEYGFSAEVTEGDRSRILIEANLIEAVRFWLRYQHGRDPFSARLELKLEEEHGIVAYATYGA
ncbi:YxcD family protein [Aneurinibacillus uraniidurans]|uniref:YxcD family protein n=1 Tax=Aneurinibacillus uraniidurans TaxID=2966586 RepID=UPI00234A41DD|nr:YxcD family protein [Aneurinibacillus sp. B1]WCN39485.1 YxcD family protein [Aneurinibacillus sp. B1]